LEHELLVDILASVDITVGTVSSILMAQKPPQKESTMTSNINELLSLTGFESDTSSHRNTTKLASNAGVTSEMEALGLGGEVLGAAVPSVNEMKVDLTDWENIIT
jgi:hypothetical protein